MSEQNQKIALQFITSLGAADAAGVAATLNRDAVAVAKGFGKLSGSRPYEMIVGMIGAFKLLFPAGMKTIIKTVTASGDRVIVEWEGDATTSAGKAYCNQYCMVFTFHDGKIRQINEYYCTLLADDALWPLVEPLMRQ